MTDDMVAELPKASDVTQPAPEPKAEPRDTKLYYAKVPVRTGWR